MVNSLSRFGTFTGLKTTHSSSTDADPNTPTFTFYGSKYTSNYITFTPVEEYTNTPNGSGGYTTLQTPTAAQQAIGQAVRPERLDPLLQHRQQVRAGRQPLAAQPGAAGGQDLGSGRRRDERPDLLARQGHHRQRQLHDRRRSARSPTTRRPAPARRPFRSSKRTWPASRAPVHWRHPRWQIQRPALPQTAAAGGGEPRRPPREGGACGRQVSPNGSGCLPTPTSRQAARPAAREVEPEEPAEATYPEPEPAADRPAAVAPARHLRARHPRPGDLRLRDLRPLQRLRTWPAARPGAAARSTAPR